MDGQDRLLAFNAGSSSLKAELFERGPPWQSRMRVLVEGLGGDRVVVRVAGHAAETIATQVDHRGGAELVLDRVLGTNAGSRWCGC